MNIDQIKKKIENKLNYNLPPQGVSAKIDDIRVMSEEDGDIKAVEVDYHIDYKIPYYDTDSDGITHTMYDYDTEYSTKIFNIL